MHYCFNCGTYSPIDTRTAWCPTCTENWIVAAARRIDEEWLEIWQESDAHPEG